MNFTKRTEYAIRALLDISSNDTNNPVKRETIAESQNISPQFLEQILIPLTKAKIIKSVRGPGGGFILNKDPKNISVWDVFDCVEKTTKLYEDSKTSKGNKDSKEVKKIQAVWDIIDNNLESTMSNISLNDILNAQPTKSKKDDFKSLLKSFEPENNKIFNIINDDGKIINSEWKVEATNDELVEAYKFMQFVRSADEMCMSYQRQGRLFTFPPNLGQEGIATAAGKVMQKDDWLVPAYREVAAWLLKGASIKDIFLLWGGNEKGYLFSGAKNALPVSVPIASQLPHASGIGFALNYQNKKAAVFAFVGDGGTSQGDFHEALNFASVWKAPVIFIIQNNQYAISVPVQEQTASKNLAIKSKSYGIPGIRVDGNDYLAMHKILTEARKFVTGGNGPILIEAVTYRKGAHTTSDDPTLYRTEKEEKIWAQKDPIKRLRQYLIKKRLWKAEDDEKMIEGYKKEVETEFIEYEKEIDYKLDDVFDHMYKKIPDVLKNQKLNYSKFLNWEKGAK